MHNQRLEPHSSFVNLNTAVNGHWSNVVKCVLFIEIAQNKCYCHAVNISLKGIFVCTFEIVVLEIFEYFELFQSLSWNAGGAERLICKIHWTINFFLKKFHQNCFIGLFVKYIAQATFYCKNSIKSVLSAYLCPLYCHIETLYNLPFSIKNSISY